MSGLNTAKSSPFRGVTLFRPTMKWRAQISANGKTTSLGDHDTEEQAATAFDRASISKAGRKAKTNFPLEKYENEIDELEGMDLNELVAMLRSKAKKHGAQTSHFRGVSLLKQTKKWHAQINVGGKQVHLGFFPTEEFAARAYDRAAINKGAKENTVRIVTNFEFAEYADELAFLRQVDQHDLIEALATDSKRRYAKKSANTQNLQPAPAFIDIAANLDLFKKAERAHPKATLRNRLYEDFGKKTVKGGTADSDLTGREAGNATDLGSQTEPEKENQLPSAPEAPSGEKGPKVVESGAEKSKMGIPRHLETMFSDAGLADPDRRAHLPLPVADPLTGAPAIVVRRDGFRYINPDDVNLKALESPARASSQNGVRKTSADKRPPKKKATENLAPTKKKAMEKGGSTPAAAPAPAPAPGTPPTSVPKPGPKRKRAQPVPAANAARPTIDSASWELPSPVKKRRTAVNYKPSSPERLRAWASFPFTTPFAPQRQACHVQESSHGPTVLADTSEKAARQLTFAFNSPTRMPQTPASKALTKRQQAIQDTHEAAALLTSCSRLPLHSQEGEEDEEGENRLMHFANVAILAELAGGFEGAESLAAGHSLLELPTLSPAISPPAKAPQPSRSAVRTPEELTITGKKAKKAVAHQTFKSSISLVSDLTQDKELQAQAILREMLSSKD